MFRQIEPLTLPPSKIDETKREISGEVHMANEAAEIPMACSIDDPDCEACQ